jgi:uncharacterized membrane protein YczE
MDFTLWYIIIGVLLIGMALLGTRLKRLPLTTALLYLLVGVALGPWGAGLIRVDPIMSSALLERATEFAVIVSLFTAGLKLRFSPERPRVVDARAARVDLHDGHGRAHRAGRRVPAQPAVGGGHPAGGGAGADDPVLASDVQVAHPLDQDRLRFGLTGEAGLNDGTAFPFVMLGLGLLGHHEIGAFGWRWAAVDVLWAIAGGLGIGAVAGTLIGTLVIHLRRTRKEAVGLDEFLSLGLLALAYGGALWLHTYGFLAAFAAGVALRRIESRASRGNPPPDVGHAAASGQGEEVATNPETAPAVHGPGGARVQRAARTHLRGSPSSCCSRDAHGRLPAARGAVVRAAAVPRHPPARRRDRAARLPTVGPPAAARVLVWRAGAWGSVYYLAYASSTACRARSRSG